MDLQERAVPGANPPTRDSRALATARRPDRCERIALVLQGGGALGAYQAGVCYRLRQSIG